MQTRSECVWSKEIAEAAYDHELEVTVFKAFMSVAETHKEMYEEKMSLLICYYEVESEDEILSSNVRNKATFLQRDNRRYGDMKERILLSIKIPLQKA